VQKELPKWLEDQYAARLTDALREPLTGPVIKGEQFGDKAKFLQGAWRFFSVITPNAAGKMEPQIFQFSIVFLSPTSTSIELIMITKQRQWKGVAHMLGSHLYLHVSDSEETKSALLITNLPVKKRLMVAGAGLTIEPNSEVPSTPAVMAFVCFAEKWERPSSDIKGVQATIERLMRSGHDIAASDVGVLRSEFCRPYASADEFSTERPLLAQYMQGFEFNGEPGAFMKALHLAYP
jgi:hypothetical protein